MEDFIAQLSFCLQEKEYLIDLRPQISGVQALLYARSPRRFRLGFAKVEDHFLFLDGTRLRADRPENIREIYRHFSDFANRGYRTPHAWRMSFPNLAVIILSENRFPADLVAFVRAASLGPWYGGETGQAILVDIGEKQAYSLVTFSAGRYPRYGALPLRHASDLIREICEQVFTER